MDHHRVRPIAHTSAPTPSSPNRRTTLAVEKGSVKPAYAQSSRVCGERSVFSAEPKQLRQTECRPVRGWGCGARGVVGGVGSGIAGVPDRGGIVGNTPVVDSEGLAASGAAWAAPRRRRRAAVGSALSASMTSLPVGVARGAGTRGGACRLPRRGGVPSDAGGRVAPFVPLPAAFGAGGTDPAGRRGGIGRGTGAGGLGRDVRRASNPAQRPDVGEPGTQDVQQRPQHLGVRGLDGSLDLSRAAAARLPGRRRRRRAGRARIPARTRRRRPRPRAGRCARGPS